MIFARFRFQDFAGITVDIFSSDDCLLTPGERTVDDIFVGQVGAEERLIHLCSPNGLKRIRQSEQGPGELLTGSVEQNRFTFPLFSKEDLINDIAG